ncbi:MAG: nucleotidyltransferase domain-containing protein [bacterium]
MKPLKTLNLKDNEVQAITELKKRILRLYPDAAIVLFGSKARGDFNKDSDIDLLILLDATVDSKVESNIISNALSDVYLKYPENIFNLLIENKELWNSPKYQAMPIAENIHSEGLPL